MSACVKGIELCNLIKKYALEMRDQKQKNKVRSPTLQFGTPPADATR